MDNKGHKCIFVGYSKDKKSYKVYDPIARKVIIRRDVKFVENKAWDGSIEKIVKIIDAMDHHDTKDEMVQTRCTSQCTVPSTPGIVTQITVQNTLVRSACAQSTPRVNKHQQAVQVVLHIQIQH